MLPTANRQLPNGTSHPGTQHEDEGEEHSSSGGSVKSGELAKVIAPL